MPGRLRCGKSGPDQLPVVLVPVIEVAEPRRGLRGCADPCQGPAKAQESFAGLGPGPAGQVGAHVALDMDQAALNGGIRPAVRERGGDPGTTVGDHHPRSRKTSKQRRPRGLLLGVAPLPADHMLTGDRDQAAPRADVDPVDLDLVMDLARGRNRGGNIPAPRRAAPEGPGRTERVNQRLAAGTQQPAQKRTQLRTPAHIRAFTRAARPAFQAPVALLTRGRFPVPYQRLTADQTFQRYASTPATLSFQSLATPKFARQHWEAGTIHTHVLSYNPACAIYGNDPAESHGDGRLVSALSWPSARVVLKRRGGLNGPAGKLHRA
ncbi:hypothetical protein AHiyo8_30380 [Arthrobacter sp. Hiyo8]|nr:hypothetical protein AHiyo8_30380 [Arthrobacter sp. Hiyo8]